MLNSKQFWILYLGHLNLFRISILEFRIYFQYYVCNYLLLCVARYAICASRYVLRVAICAITPHPQNTSPSF
jgi:hypothetical protein